MKLFCLRILFVLLLLFPCSRAAASTLAVFPLLDLSRDANGVNFTLTDAVRAKAAEYGFDVLPENEVMSFMVRHRIRNLGILSSYEIIKLRKELAVEYVLLGTVCQLTRKPNAKVSISLQLIRTQDEEIVWSTIKDLHEADLISLLGLANPESLNDLYTEYFSTLLNTIPTETFGAADEKPAIGLLSVQMQPVYVRPSERIKLSARMYSATEGDSIENVYLQINDRIQPVEIDGDSYFLKSSWQAQESPGTYTVDLVVEFPSGIKQVVNIGEYTVDTVAPEVVVNLRGTVVDDVVYFNKDLLISSRLIVPELLSKWQVSVYDEDDERVVNFSGSGKLPPRIFWNGTLSSVEKAPDGKYRITVTVWDRAGNSSADEKTVILRNTRPSFNITSVKNDHGITLSLENDIEYPIAFWWVKVYEQKGRYIMTKVGEGFPADIDIEYDFEKSTAKLEFLVAAQDVYGNRGSKRIRDVLKLNEVQEEVEYVQESDWLENF